jgi:hypothetical protein
MTIKIVVLIASLGIGFSTYGQGKEPRHAPTAETCKRDLALWYSPEKADEYQKAETLHTANNTPNHTDIAKLPLDELTARMEEMYDCGEIGDPVPGRPDLLRSNNVYFEAGGFYHEVFADRFIHFVFRHGLLAQLRREDAQGKR